MNSGRAYDEEDDRPGFWARLREHFGGGTDDEDLDETFQPRRPQIRLDTSRNQTVAVRRQPSTLSDAKIVADGLKAGQQQIVNLENAPVDKAARVLDFLSGVVYALDGSVEKVGEKVYLFVPANVHIQIESGDTHG